jgi:hypothetical protein
VEKKNAFSPQERDKTSSALVASINDLREMEFSGKKMSADEKRALVNFDKYRIKVLSKETDEQQFHYKYRQLQVIANLGDWRDFLAEEYDK